MSSNALMSVDVIQILVKLKKSKNIYEIINYYNLITQISLGTQVEI